MTHQRDIIEVVKELQERKEKIEVGEYRIRSASIDTARLVDEMVLAFPDLARALLTKDEQLKIAIEALEKLDTASGDEPWSEKVACEALSKIRSLPSA